MNQGIKIFGSECSSIYRAWTDQKSMVKTIISRGMDETKAEFNNFLFKEITKRIEKVNLLIQEDKDN